MSYRHSSEGAAPALRDRMRHWEAVATPGFGEWLAAEQVSLAVTAGRQRLFLMGVRPNGEFVAEDAEIEGATAVTAAPGGALYVATRFQLWRLQNALAPGAADDGGHDALLVPQIAYSTGAIGIHDLAVESSGRVVFSSIIFNCLATLDEVENFAPLWAPPFISEIGVGVRCRLTGVGLHEGRAAWVTCAAATDGLEEWRDHRRDGGIVVEVPSGAILCDGLSMPDSPRWHDGRLWLAEAGSGHIGFVGRDGRFERVAFVPGVLRGLEFVGGYAVAVTASMTGSDTFAGLELSDTMEARQLRSRASVNIIDLRSGEVAHCWEIRGKEIEQLFDLAILPGIRYAASLGLGDSALQELVTIGPWAANASAGETTALREGT